MMRKMQPCLHLHLLLHHPSDMSHFHLLLLRNSVMQSILFGYMQMEFMIYSILDMLAPWNKQRSCENHLFIPTSLVRHFILLIDLLRPCSLYCCSLLKICLIIEVSGETIWVCSPARRFFFFLSPAFLSVSVCYDCWSSWNKTSNIILLLWLLHVLTVVIKLSINHSTAFYCFLLVVTILVSNFVWRDICSNRQCVSVIGQCLSCMWRRIWCWCLSSVCAGSPTLISW